MRLGAIHENVLSFTIRVRNVELVLVKLKLADQGMSHSADSVSVTDIGAHPGFAETWPRTGQFGDQ